jgi:hypothetical protein
MSKNELQKMKLSNFNYLGLKTGRTGKTELHNASGAPLLKNSLKQVNPINGNFRAWSHKNCNFNLKRNKIRKLKFRPTSVKNYFHVIGKNKILRAPHNTSQFLIENFKNENPTEKARQVTPQPELTALPDDITDDFMDYLCVTGGTMKGINFVDSNLGLLIQDGEFLNSDEKDNERLSQYSTEFSTDGFDDISLTTADYPHYEYS